MASSFRRRPLLLFVTMLLGLVSLGFRAPGITVEGEGVGSSTSSAWGCGCGPIYRARTAGGAAGIRIVDRTDPTREGVSVEVRGAVEEESIHYAGEGACSHDSDPIFVGICGGPAKRSSVPDHTAGAVDARVGWSASDARARWNVGVLVYSAWARSEVSTVPSTLWLLWPEIEKSAPLDERWTAKVGTGAPALPMLRRPALVYGEIDYATRGFELSGVLGWFRTGVAWSDRSDQRTESNNVIVSSILSWASDPTLTMHLRGAVPLGGGLSLLSGLGLGGPINTAIGRGPDASVDVGLRWAR